MKRHILVSDQERPLIWIDHAHRRELLGVHFTGRQAVAVAIGLPLALLVIRDLIVVFVAVFS